MAFQLQNRFRPSQALSTIQCHSRQLCRRCMKHYTIRYTFIHKRNIIPTSDRANNINIVGFLITHRRINIERRNAFKWNIFRSTYVVIISDCDMPQCYEVLCYSTSSDCRGRESNWNLPAVEWTRRFSFVIADARYTFQGAFIETVRCSEEYGSCRSSNWYLSSTCNDGAVFLELPFASRMHLLNAT